ncbi:MAG: hypothetical protein IJG47_07705 [Microbacterium sp.]|nr:hypothetical protein [Microbacterium sp.]
MSEYRVDPDGVLGVLAGLDDLESEFESAHRDIDTAATDGPSALTVDGRKVLARAWETFMEQRQRVPGKVMHVINTSAQAVSNATLEIVSGDEQMAMDLPQVIAVGVLEALGSQVSAAGWPER